MSSDNSVARGEQALQGDAKTDGQIGLHVFMRLSATGVGHGSPVRRGVIDAAAGAP